MNTDALLIMLFLLVFVAAITISLIFYLKARNKERMALIEKGVDVSDIYRRAQDHVSFPWLKIGIVITAICIGVLLVIVPLIIFPNNAIIRDGVMLLMVLSGLLFGGIGMIIAHFTGRQKKK